MATKKYKVAIDAGHGGYDDGAVKYVTEDKVNLVMALATRDYLEYHGVEVLMSRTTDTATSIKDFCAKANEWGADLAVSEHNNAGGGDGFEAFHHYGGGLGKTLAANIEAEVKKIGQNSRGLKIKQREDGQDYFGFIRLTSMPAVILEGAFVDNKADAAQIDTVAEQQAFGYAYARGILKTLGIKDKGYPPKTVAEPAATKKEDKRVMVNIELPQLSKGDKGASVKAMQSLIIADGISCGSYGADGDFGAGTANGLAKYQKKHGLTVDEICGAKTWASLLK
ncbi:MAG: N-acetylmuramoyl-L-alanine amidase [Bacteroidales bacterium]|nr:N-acetylmuramoyl-L-alanine amidase [Bacteroidales bacterium]